MRAFICILGSVKQVRLGGSGCVGRLASFSKRTFGWHLFLNSAGGYPKTYTAACSSTESIPYCWYHPAYLTALSPELLLPRPARSSPRRCTSEVPRLQVFVVIPLCVCWYGLYSIHAADHFHTHNVMSQILVYTKICMCYPEKSIWT